ncbi:dnaJ homolog subfamily C member 9 [Centruroides vittatus]|uniref:dnaJ homolog subfamily C member 9 n=1 Tax=Centruroides vittatus TaxID=120091 RepID=UPI0035109305
MGLMSDCQTYFQTKNLYEILNVEKDASNDQIKKAYRLLSLKVHPDHAEEEKKEESTRRFQTLAKIYLILSDEDRRKIYDETGSADDEDCYLEDRDWYAYWRSLFPRITDEDIKSYLTKYKGSEEEINDIKEYYLKYEGDLNKISQCVIGYETERDRYIEIIRDMISKEEVPEFKKFTQQCKKQQKNKYKKEAKEAEKMKRKLRTGDNKSLEEMIGNNRIQREGRFDHMLADLEKKYCKPPPMKKRRKQ